MNAVASPPLPGGQDGHFGAALVFSLMAHAIVILGIGFHFAKPAPSVPTLDVTLVNIANAETPRKADFLAQADNTGGGNARDAHRPGAPVSGPLPLTGAGIAPVPVTPAVPPRQPASGPRVLATTSQAPTTTVAVRRDSHAQRQLPDRVAPITVTHRLEMAKLEQEVREQEEAYARRPRRRYISANTRNVADAAYQVAWVHRIERIGNLNYPDAARRRHLHGDVVLSVTIGRDGHVRGVAINAGSGSTVLDDAAKRIVHLAAPFAPIPHDRDDDGHRVDELVITRTWQFLPGDRLETRATLSQ